MAEDLANLERAIRSVSLLFNIVVLIMINGSSAAVGLADKCYGVCSLFGGIAFSVRNSTTNETHIGAKRF